MDGAENPYRLYNRSMSQIHPALCMTDEEDFLDSDIGTRLIHSIASQKKGICSLIYTSEEPFDGFAGEWNHDDLPDQMTDPLECTFFSFAGRAVLHNALKAVATQMFPDQSVFEVCGDDNVEILVLPIHTIVFDLYGFYFSKHEKWSGFSTESVVSMFRLNQMKSRLV